MLSRYRNLAVLVVVITAELILLAFQVRTGQDITLLRSWTVAAVSPMARLMEGLRYNTIGVVERYILLIDVKSENERLKKQLDEFKLENQFLKTELSTADRARALSVFQERSPSRTVAARVIGTGTGANSKVVFIDRGTNDGVRRGMAVITPDGIVGKVTFVFPSASQVLLITDPTFAAGVVSLTNRVPGTLKGLGRSQVLVHWVQNEMKVDEGEWFYTSGDDRVFPKGLPAGQVKVVRSGTDFKEIYLDPSGFINGLDEVLVVLEGIHQSVPDEPPAPEGPVIVLPGPPADPTADQTQQKNPSLQTDADRLRNKIKRIGELQGVQFGSAGPRLPNFNMDPAQVSRPVEPVYIPQTQVPPPNPATNPEQRPVNPSPAAAQPEKKQ